MYILLTWTSGEPSTSIVEYGTDNTLDQFSHDTSFVVDHTITLTGLMPGTVYYCRVGSVDPYGNGPVWSPVATFSTSWEEKDTKNPEIENVVVIPGDTYCIISVYTDEETAVIVDWGLSDDYNNTVSDSDFSRAHYFNLTGLSPMTLYLYRITVYDMSGNMATTGDSTFTTQYSHTMVPEIVSSYPQDGANGVPEDSVFWIVFST